MSCMCLFITACTSIFTSVVSFQLGELNTCYVFFNLLTTIFPIPLMMKLILTALSYFLLHLPLTFVFSLPRASLLLCLLYFCLCSFLYLDNAFTYHSCSFCCVFITTRDINLCILFISLVLWFLLYFFISSSVCSFSVLLGMECSEQ